jgi:hypothetical protein
MTPKQIADECRELGDLILAGAVFGRDGLDKLCRLVGELATCVNTRDELDLLKSKPPAKTLVEVFAEEERTETKRKRKDKYHGSDRNLRPQNGVT